eukprot:TRINITY_DN10010_c0_g1_i1.p1 TRINITY_DN10010_c0_g1~~TRINITY_DN10010_c0_g1_i1.p1  ORF type:complete len:379 (+),score=89.63 TRINITY_DN10010_c0_g1_i1:131-1267(+)
MASLVDNRQSVLFADVNLNINTKGWKTEYVPANVAKPQQISHPLKLAPLPPLKVTPNPPVQQIHQIENVPDQEEEQVYSPIEAKPMPKRFSGTPLEAELVNKIQPPLQSINIPIQRLDISEKATTKNETKDQTNMESLLKTNSAGKQNNAEDFTKEFMGELMGGPAGPPPISNIPGGEELTKNFLSQLMNGSLTQPATQPAAQPTVQPKGSTIWDAAPIQPRKPCKKPQDQAEWEALLNANIAGMAENEEEFTQGFMANLMGGPKGTQNAPTPKGTGSYIKSNPGGKRSATPPGLRSVPKAPTCWACSEPVAMGMKILKIKGYPMHPECFVCTTCYVPLKTSNVFISNDRLFCREHIQFGPKSIRPLSRGPTPEFTEF